ncbi:hypothetical protein D3C86_1299860 [compost metagenome]
MNVATTQFIYTADAADLALKRNQRQQGTQLADVKMLLQGRLRQVIDQLVLDQSGIGLADINLARHLRQEGIVQPFGYRLRWTESNDSLIRRDVLQGVFTQGFGMGVVRVGQRQATGFETIGDRNFQVIER